MQTKSFVLGLRPVFRWVVLVACFYGLSACTGALSEKSKEISGALYGALIGSGVCSSPDDCRRKNVSYLDGGADYLHLYIFGVEELEKCMEILAIMLSDERLEAKKFYLQVDFYPRERTEYSGFFWKSNESVLAVEVDYK